jgi:hypothetical protein
MQVWFETLTIECGDASPHALRVIKVWLRNPYRMLFCTLNDLIVCQLESAQAPAQANSFSLDSMPYKEYRTLAPHQDCKMPVLIEEPTHRVTPFSEHYILEREEFQRIVSTARSISSLL